MEHDLPRIRRTPAGRTAGLLALTVLWAALLAFSPWLLIALGVADPMGLTLVPSMLICGFTSSPLLGALLVRARAYRLLAACAAVGLGLWIVEFEVLRDPDVQGPEAVLVAFSAASAVVLVVAPLAAGAAACHIRRELRSAGRGA